MLHNDFFTRALASAARGLEDFSAELEKIDADPNSKNNRGTPLIHAIIETIPDDQLPAFLTVLVQHNVDLHARDLFFPRQPLALAAHLLKKNAVQFLIEQHVEVNDPIHPALLDTISSLKKSEDDKLNIVKILINNKANVDIQDEDGKSALMHAAEIASLKIMVFLISKKANLFLVHHFHRHQEHITVMGIIYNEYERREECCSDLTGYQSYINKAKSCLTYLIIAARHYLYHQYASLTNEDVIYKEIQNQIQQLAGKFKYLRVNNTMVEKLLQKHVATPVFERIMNEHEQLHSFKMGSKLSATQVTVPPIYRFFQRTNGLDLVSHIFSFVHEETPHAAKNLKPK